MSTTAKVMTDVAPLAFPYHVPMNDEEMFFFSLSLSFPLVYVAIKFIIIILQMFSAVILTFSYIRSILCQRSRPTCSLQGKTTNL